VPIGKGQRCLIVSPPRAGKTVLMQNIANAIATNHPDAKLIVLLIDERPEEVTDMQRSVQGRGRLQHLRRARHAPRAGRRDGHREGQAPRRAQARRGHPARLHHPPRPRLQHRGAASGKILSGGVDANALHKPKRFFGAARNLEEGGSLTIIATALVDTGSRMDEVIFEEFKGTGNSEIHLDRKLMEKRIFPCLDINKSATRKEELLLPEFTLQRVWLLRQLLHPLNVIDSMEFLLDKVTRTETNREFLESMNQ
jgi:transcription termination factor Rho